MRYTKGRVHNDKTNRDTFLLRDESFTDLENLPEPDVLAGEIIDGLEAALAGFRTVLEDLEE
ncbi:hypothetical protein [Neolewinella persica]|uniref:hypothetical protein n=1 Tax=Neolewinella persica TaxID=70998 RepID=UPI0003650801|nr:hypothetical protein [Neolewinella persica]